MDRLGYYKRLGVDSNASISEIKSAYRKLAMKYHSDGAAAANILNQCKTEEEKKKKKTELDKMFSSITEAYEVLSDEKKRRDYDTGADEMSFNFGGMGEGIFNSFFGGGGGFERQREQKTKAKVEKITVELKDILTEKKVLHKVRTKRICRPCSGIGSEKSNTCAKCKGKGICLEVINMGGMILHKEVYCSSCKGEGIIKSGPSCKECKGAGSTVSEESFEVTIPRGVTDEYQLVYREKGNEEKGVRRGDLVFIIKVKEDSKFIRIATKNLYTEVSVPVENLLKGENITIPLLTRETIEIELPDIKNNDLGEEFLLLKGHGLPKEREKNGHLFVRIIPKFPDASALRKISESLLQPPNRSPALHVSFIARNTIESLSADEPQDEERSHNAQRCSTM
ncbi:heat shock protein beta-6 [Nematocida sp. LUAm3]|nr:heat shock protein beta-6 [Nematocida sp. LUAm3]KAI5175370.1 heat shock protein beta-6 [Nematocida sp. LUAm2]KAI5177673.1 heat shock protein beta-6 [Nematocida sp. LUAm1]